MIYVNSDVPFMQHINMYQVIRAGRRRWAVGQLVGIGIRSFFLVAVSAAAVVLPFWGRLEFSSDWGKLIYTLASVSYTHLNIWKRWRQIFCFWT